MAYLYLVSRDNKIYSIIKSIDLYTSFKYIQLNKEKQFIKDIQVRTSNVDVTVIVKLFKTTSQYYTLYIHKIIYKSKCCIVSKLNKNNFHDFLKEIKHIYYNKLYLHENVEFCEFFESFRWLNHYEKFNIMESVE